MRRIVVRSSPVHGRGVFAAARIRAGETILQYKGKLMSWQEAQRQYARSAAEDGHTFFFDLEDGRVIDGAQGGNSARWVNHSCAPNCESEQDGRRVFFHALRDIEPGEELFIDFDFLWMGENLLRSRGSMRAAADPTPVEERCWPCPETADEIAYPPLTIARRPPHLLDHDDFDAAIC